MTAILIVDDSAIIRNMLKKNLLLIESFRVIGEAGNGLRAVELARELKPDIIIMDFVMPLMDGLEATKIIMQENPCAIIMFSSEENFELVYKALEYGAVDIIQKPNLSIINSFFYKSFLDKIKTIAEANKSYLNSFHSQKLEKTQDLENQNILSDIKNKSPQYEIVGIASSTGGPLAIQKILQELPPHFSLPILIVQHIENKYDLPFVNWLSQTSALPVSLAKDKQKIEKGHVYIAPADYHMTVIKNDIENEYYISLNQDAEVHFLRPAADPLFFSLAKHFENKTISIVLTGMGSDGAEGSLRIMSKGGYTIAESEETSVVFGMPKAAINKAAIREIVPLSSIAQKISSLVLAYE